MNYLGYFKLLDHHKIQWPKSFSFFDYWVVGHLRCLNKSLHKVLYINISLFATCIYHHSIWFLWYRSPNIRIWIFFMHIYIYIYVFYCMHIHQYFCTHPMLECIRTCVCLFVLVVLALTFPYYVLFNLVCPQ